MAFQELSDHVRKLADPCRTPPGIWIRPVSSRASLRLLVVDLRTREAAGTNVGKSGHRRGPLGKGGLRIYRPVHNSWQTRMPSLVHSIFVLTPR